MNTVIHAPRYLESCAPVIFLAGPINWGSGSWHDRAIAELARLAGSFDVATPRRPLATTAEFPDADYAAQVDWETHHLRLAGRSGVVLFWLERELSHRCERPHAQTTRFELGEWKERHQRDGCRLVLGIEDGFTGARYLRRRFAQDCPAVPIHARLEDACRAAVEALPCNR